MKKILCGFWCVFLNVSVTSLSAADKTNSEKREPLPLEVAASLKSHNARSSFDLSPDGKWLAHTVNRDETIEMGPYSYSGTGKSFAEGNARMQVFLSSTDSEKVIKVGGIKGSSWAPVWSPDGKYVAYYSDDDGEAGVWVWEKSTGKTKRFANAIARPFFGFELIRWSKDSKKLLVKILPDGMNVADANALVPPIQENRVYRKHNPNEPSVVVFSSAKKTDKSSSKIKVTRSAFLNRIKADIAILNLQSGKIERIAKNVHPSWYMFSPDEKYVAYTNASGGEKNTQQTAFDIKIIDVKTRESKDLAKDVRLGFGIELSWSPDSEHIAYINSGQMGKGEVVYLHISGQTAQYFRHEETPGFNTFGGERAPLWSEDGKYIYAIAEDKNLWRIDVKSGTNTLLSTIKNYDAMEIISRPEQATVWTTENKFAWMLAKESNGDHAGIFKINIHTGANEPALIQKKSYSSVFNIDASDQTQELVFVAKDQQHLADGWAFNTQLGTVRQVSHINPAIDHYEMGTAKLIEYKGIDGQKLRSALLLPPGYEKGRLPLFVWVYGGSNGSDSVNRYGFWGDTPSFNMQILATRGYAVLYPDTPLNVGTPMKDMFDTVMPAVDAAIEQGYADPDRLAISGQSYGSYSTLAVIAQTPRFRAAIITAAVVHPDLIASYLNMSHDGVGSTLGYYEQGQGRMGGSLWDYPQRFLDNSPIFLFDQIETPLLIGQGDQDGRLIASDAIFVGLDRLGKEVEYRIYEKEGHVIMRTPNVIDFWRRRLEFLSNHLNAPQNR